MYIMCPMNLISVKDAPHFGAMFDVEEIQHKVLGFLRKELK